MKTALKKTLVGAFALAGFALALPALAVLTPPEAIPSQLNAADAPPEDPASSRDTATAPEPGSIAVLIGLAVLSMGTSAISHMRSKKYLALFKPVQE